MKKNGIKNVVAFTAGGIGDFVMATSAISLIKQYDKNIKLTLITFDSFFKLVNPKLKIDDGILISNKFFNHKYKFIRYPYKFFWFIKTFFKLYKRETIIFLDISKALAVASKYIYKIKNIIGPSNRQFGLDIKNPTAKYYSQIIQMPKNNDDIHMALRYQLIIRLIFPTCNLSLPMLVHTKYLESKIIESRFMQNSKKYKIALLLHGSFIGKTWKVNNVIKLINLISKFHSEISFFIVGSTLQQKEEGDYLQKQFVNIDIRNLCGKTSLLELIEFLKKIDLLISVDTGIVHLSAALKIPAIVLYGSGLPKHAMPLYHKDICLYEGAKCSPCDKERFFGKICKNPICINSINSEIVFECLKGILFVE